MLRRALGLVLAMLADMQGNTCFATWRNTFNWLKRFFAGTPIFRWLCCSSKRKMEWLHQKLECVIMICHHIPNDHTVFSLHYPCKYISKFSHLWTSSILRAEIFALNSACNCIITSVRGFIAKHFLCAFFASQVVRLELLQAKPLEKISANLS